MKTCSVDGCINTSHCKGYCSMHYSRISRHGDVHYHPRNKKCSISGCDRPHKAKGFCKMHHKRVLKYGDPSIVKRENINGKICIVDGCENVQRSKGYCVKHYLRVVKFGNSEEFHSKREPERHGMTKTKEYQT